jgi:hypothetical protein
MKHTRFRAGEVAHLAEQDGLEQGQLGVMRTMNPAGTAGGQGFDRAALMPQQHGQIAPRLGQVGLAFEQVAVS